MVNVLSVLLLLAIAVLFIWLASRAWRSRRGWVRWPGLVLSGLLSLIFLVATAVSALGFYRLSVAPYQYTTANVKVAMSPDQVKKGEAVANLCGDCHSSNGTTVLDGSKDNFVAGGPPVGVLYAPNLTPGGPLKDWSDGEVIRAIREGVDKKGRPLMIMPSQAFHAMSDEDVQAIVAYLRSQPEVKRDLPETNLNVLAALFVGSGLFPTSAQAPITGQVTAPSAGTADYGKYVTAAYGCHDCHGANLTGSSGGDGTPAPNLTHIVPSWTEDQFVKFFREGKDPTGRDISPDNMPWKSYSKAFTDAQLHDLYTYLHGLQQAETSK